MAARGVLDLRGFDPEDGQWWQRLRWATAHVEADCQLMFQQALHRHWLARLVADGAETALTQAGAALAEILALTRPWLRDSLPKTAADAGPETADDSRTVAEYHRQVGRPGEPQYEAMVANLDRLFDKLDAQRGPAGPR